MTAADYKRAMADSRRKQGLSVKPPVETLLRVAALVGRVKS